VKKKKKNWTTKFLFVIVNLLIFWNKILLKLYICSPKFKCEIKIYFYSKLLYICLINLTHDFFLSFFSSNHSTTFSLLIHKLSYVPKIFEALNIFLSKVYNSITLIYQHWIPKIPSYILLDIFIFFHVIFTNIFNNCNHSKEHFFLVFFLSLFICSLTYLFIILIFVNFISNQFIHAFMLLLEILISNNFWEFFFLSI